MLTIQQVDFWSASLVQCGYFICLSAEFCVPEVRASLGQPYARVSSKPPVLDCGRGGVMGWKVWSRGGNLGSHLFLTQAFSWIPCFQSHDHPHILWTAGSGWATVADSMGGQRRRKERSPCTWIWQSGSQSHYMFLWEAAFECAVRLRGQTREPYYLGPNRLRTSSWGVPCKQKAKRSTRKTPKLVGVCEIPRQAAWWRFLAVGESSGHPVGCWRWWAEQCFTWELREVCKQADA